MYYDEGHYLFPYYDVNNNGMNDDDFLLMFEDIFRLRKNNIEIIYNNKIKNKEKITIYKEYLLLIAKVVKEIGIKDNTISYSLVIKILLKNGIFSNFNSFKYESIKDEEYYGCLGLQVIKGNACCRHISSFYKDIFDILNLYNEKLFCNFASYIDGNNFAANKATHVINIIFYNGGYLGFDMTNDCFFKFIDEFFLKSIFSNSKIIIFNKPYMNILSDGISYEEMVNSLELYKMYAGKEIISSEMYLDILRETRDNILKSEQLLLDFNQERKKYVKKIIYR